MTTLYGIKNCDTVKKARKWLEDSGVDYRFHDFRSDGLDAAQLRAWVAELGWETLLNRRGTTWRQVPEAIKVAIDETSAIALMLEKPAIIKRPVLEHGRKVSVGFTADAYKMLF